MANVKYRRLGEEEPQQAREDRHQEDKEDREKDTTQRQYSWCKMALKVTAVLVVLVVIGAVVIPYAIGGPLHAQCTINWYVVYLW